MEGSGHGLNKTVFWHLLGRKPMKTLRLPGAQARLSVKYIKKLLIMGEHYKIVCTNTVDSLFVAKPTVLCIRHSENTGCPG